MLGILLKLQFQRLYHGLFQKNSRGKQSPFFKLFLLLLFFYVLAAGLFMFGLLFHSLLPLLEMGLGWLYFSIAGLLAFVLGLFLNLFQAAGSLFEAKDNAFLLSMPIPTGTILLSRMASLYILGLFFSLLVLLPAGFVYLREMGMDLGLIVCLLLMAVLLPFLINAISALLGYVLSRTSARFRRKNLVTAVLSMGFLGLYFYFYSRLPGYLTKLLASAENVADLLKQKAFPLYHFGMAVGEKDALSLLWMLLICVLPFILVWYLLQRGFLQLSGSAAKSAASLKGEGKHRRRSLRQALLHREIRRFFSNAMVALNVALGLLLLLGFSVFFLIKKADILPLLPLLGIPEAALYVLFPCFCLATCYISGVSISLEGKEHWILRSLPVKTETLLWTKLFSHLLLAAPVLLLSQGMLLLSSSVRSAEFFLALLLPWAYLLATALLGLGINLHFPNLDWNNEVLLVKQSRGSFLCLFAGLGLLLIPALLYWKLLKERMSLGAFLLLVLLFYLVGSFFLCRHIKTEGVRRYEEL